MGRRGGGIGGRLRNEVASGWLERASRGMRQLRHRCVCCWCLALVLVRLALVLALVLLCVCVCVSAALPPLLPPLRMLRRRCGCCCTQHPLLGSTYHSPWCSRWAPMAVRVIAQGVIEQVVRNFARDPQKKRCVAWGCEEGGGGVQQRRSHARSSRCCECGQLEAEQLGACTTRQQQHPCCRSYRRPLTSSSFPRLPA